MNARHRRRYRRNPGMGGFSVNGIMHESLAIVKGAGFVLAGTGLTNVVSSAIPFLNASNAQVAIKKLAIGVGVATVARRMVGPDNARLMGIGAVVPSFQQLLVAQLPSLATYFAPTIIVATPVAPAAVSGYTGTRRLGGYGNLNLPARSRMTAASNPQGYGVQR